uniref:MalT-like TPR region domain-containing protein n=1 Tax=Aureoumbra lagunensis TaxID=44058 RepID=A0A7S3NJH1_9STRA
MSIGGAKILTANRYRNEGRMVESVQMYLEALDENDLDERSRFVAYYSLGNVFVLLGETKKSCRAWLDALKIQQGGSDRATVALQVGTVFYKQAKFTEAVKAFRLAIEYDIPESKITRIAHQRLGIAIREKGAQTKFSTKKLVQRGARSPSIATVHSWIHNR